MSAGVRWGAGSRPWQALLALLVLLGGCQADERYVGVGDVLGTDAGGVTIKHDRIYRLMPPGTTRFAVADAAAAAVARGGRIRFELRRRGDALLVTAADGLAEGNPGMHDHTPHHGGVVSMHGMIHLEATAAPDGQLRLYLTDIWRRPLPLDGVEGTVTVDLPGGKRVLALRRGVSALEASAPVLAQASVDVAFNLQCAEGPVEAHFRLPLSPTAGGAAGIPAAGCVAPPAGAAAGAPRCTLRFARGIAALGSSPDGATLLVAVVDHGVSAWRLPAGEFTRGFAPPPPIAVPVAEAPHPEAPNAVVVRPDGREAVVAMENRLIRYAIDSGLVVRAYDGPGGIVRAVAWSPDGARLLVSTFYHRDAALLASADGVLQRRLPVEREAAAVAFAADGRRVAVSSENGPIALFDLASDAAPRLLHGARGPARAVAFIGDRVLVAGADGVLRVWPAAGGAPEITRPLAGPVYALAVSPDARRVAVAAGSGPLVIHDLASGAASPRLVHQAQIVALAWSGDTLASGDSDGVVALWTER